MPETHIQDYPDAGPLLPTDLLNIQRKENGLWTNYAIPAGLVNPLQILEVTVDIADLFGGEIILGPPAAGLVRAPIFTYMRYNPGTAFDGSLFTVELTESPSSNSFGSCSFNFGPFSSASILCPLPVSFSIPNPAGSWVLTTGSTLADGSITLYMQYTEAFL